MKQQFSGASEQNLQHLTRQYVIKAGETFVDLEVTKEELRRFYTKYDSTKLTEVGNIFQKFEHKTRSLQKKLKKKYGDAPALTKRGAQKAMDEAKAAAATGLKLASTGDLEAELKRRKGDGGDGGDDDGEDAGGADLALFMGGPEVESTLKGLGDATPAKVVVIGGGPAGLSACIYAARAGLRY
jgi:cation diffusion facilitator CzcD-associated flavoprotein CzcO